MNIFFDVWPFMAAAGATVEEKRSGVKSKALGHSVMIILIITGPENSQNNYFLFISCFAASVRAAVVSCTSGRPDPLFISKFHHL